MISFAQVYPSSRLSRPKVQSRDYQATSRSIAWSLAAPNGKDFRNSIEISADPQLAQALPMIWEVAFKPHLK
jgi:hypothetical protein